MVFSSPDFDSNNYSLRCGDISKMSGFIWTSKSVFLVHFSGVFFSPLIWIHIFWFSVHLILIQLTVQPSGAISAKLYWQNRSIVYVKSLPNQTALCWSTWQIHESNLNPLQNLHVEIFCPHANFLNFAWNLIAMTGLHSNASNNGKSDRTLNATLITLRKTHILTTPYTFFFFQIPGTSCKNKSIMLRLVSSELAWPTIS